MLEQISELYDKLDNPDQINDARREMARFIRVIIANLGEPDLWETDCLAAAVSDLATNLSYPGPTSNWLRLCLANIAKSLTPPDTRSPNYPLSSQREEALSGISAAQLLEALDYLESQM